MDTERLNAIVQEVIELDPTLQSEEAHLRAYMKELDIVKPHVVIDETFVARLRNELIAIPRSVPSPYMNIGWWAFRLAPIGIVALLVLMLMPPAQTPYIQQPVDTPETRDDVQMLDVDMGGAESAPSMYGFGGDTANETTMQPEAMHQKSMMMPASSETFVVEPQVVGVSVRIKSITAQESGFVVIYTYQNGEAIIGVSPLLQVGTTENLPIYLQTRTVAGGEYSAIFHRDNGDRVFTEGVDTPVYDQYRNRIETPLVIISGE